MNGIKWMLYFGFIKKKTFPCANSRVNKNIFYESLKKGKPKGTIDLFNLRLRTTENNYLTVASWP